jgi:hypothetical protein
MAVQCPLFTPPPPNKIALRNTHFLPRIETGIVVLKKLIFRSLFRFTTNTFPAPSHLTAVPA